MLECLLDATRQILADVAKETGTRLKLIPHEHDYSARTMISEAYRSGNLEEITIQYNPRAPSVDYAVAHEAIRFLRIIRAPPAERYVLASTAETRAKGLRQIERDVERMPPRFRPNAAAGVEIFYHGILNQLVSMPGDFGIHFYLKVRYPQFSSELEKGVDANFQVIHQCLGERYRVITPPIIYQASNAMNAAFASFMADLMGKDYFRPYRGTRFESAAKRFREHVSIDGGHAGDRDTTDCWAVESGMQGWYVWRQM